MSIKPLASITEFDDLLEYVEAEYNEAAKYCPAALSNYAAALGMAKSYYGQDVLQPFDMSKKATYTEAVAQAIYTARSVWQSAGCGAASSSSSSSGPSDDKDSSVTGSSLLVPLLVGGVALFAYWAFFRKK
jgi:hypothetical protein